MNGRHAAKFCCDDFCCDSLNLCREMATFKVSIIKIIMTAAICEFVKFKIFHMNWVSAGQVHHPATIRCDRLNHCK